MSPNGQVPASARPFRKTVSAPSGKKAMYANVSITTDNQFSLYVNGKFIGSSSNIANSTYSSWQSAAFYPMVELEPDANVFAVAALNDAAIAPNTQENTNPSPAGVLAGITIALADADANVTSANANPSAVPSVSLFYTHQMTRVLKINLPHRHKQRMPNHLHCPHHFSLVSSLSPWFFSFFLLG
jgi:hypothetical protein